MRLFIGIDPGFGTRGKEDATGGGIVCIKEDGTFFWEAHGYRDEAALALAIQALFAVDLSPARALMEDAPGFPGMNAKAIAGLNRSAGAFRALFAARSVLLEEIAPRKWPPLLGIALPQPFSAKRLGQMSTKERSAWSRRQKAEYVRRKEDEALRLWPGHEAWGHPGLRDAALIAEVLRRREVGGGA